MSANTAQTKSNESRALNANMCAYRKVAKCLKLHCYQYDDRCVNIVCCICTLYGGVAGFGVYTHNKRTHNTLYIACCIMYICKHREKARLDIQKTGKKKTYTHIIHFEANKCFKLGLLLFKMLPSPFCDDLFFCSLALVWTLFFITGVHSLCMDRIFVRFHLLKNSLLKRTTIITSV